MLLLDRFTNVYEPSHEIICFRGFGSGKTTVAISGHEILNIDKNYGKTWVANDSCDQISECAD